MGIFSRKNGTAPLSAFQRTAYELGRPFAAYVAGAETVVIGGGIGWNIGMFAALTKCAPAQAIETLNGIGLDGTSLFKLVGWSTTAQNALCGSVPTSMYYLVAIVSTVIFGITAALPARRITRSLNRTMKGWFFPPKVNIPSF
jgi:hypothetical protein